MVITSKQLDEVLSAKGIMLLTILKTKEQSSIPFNKLLNKFLDLLVIKGVYKTDKQAKWQVSKLSDIEKVCKWLDNIWPLANISEEEFFTELLPEDEHLQLAEFIKQEQE